jgi:serine/threonine protein kinase
MAGLEGTKLGAYELLERIGGGGMAEVYRAKQTTAFGREVAIKVIRAGYSENPSFRARFLREAQAISKLSHPNILPLIEFGEQDEILYLVMPLAREGTLRDVLKQRHSPLPPEEAIPIFTQLCDAVQYAHEQGIVHRDLKPQNVLMQRRTHVLLADFGIARDSAESEHLTATGAGIGTVEYMAPEQAMGKADPRSDIYSLGIVLYQLVTGTVPFSGTTPFQIIMKQSNEPLPDPRTFNPALPNELIQVLKTALAKDPDRRFQSAQALGRAVQQMRPDIGPAALPGPQFGSPPPISRSRPAPIPPDAPQTAPTERLNEPPEPPRGQTWAGTSAGTAFPPPPVSPPLTPTWAGSPATPPGNQGPPPIGGWAASQTPPPPDYEQPTWSTSSGAGQPARGGGNAYGQFSGPPPGIGGAPYVPAPQRRRNTRLIVIIAGALALVILFSAGAYAFSQGVFSGSSSNGIAQQPTNTTAPAATDTTQPTATNTAEPTATNTPEPTATNTPRPTPTHTPQPTATPVIISSGSGTLQGTFLFDFDTGQQTSTGADVWWDQQTSVIRTMNPVNGATIVNLGVVNFNNVTLAQLKSKSYSSTPLDGNNDATNVLVAGDVFAVHTSNGHYAKVKVVTYGYNLAIQWVTYG